MSSFRRWLVAVAGLVVVCGLGRVASAQCDWIQQKKLAQSSSLDEQAGQSVAVDGEWAVVGIPYVDNPLPRSGNVEVYRRGELGGWTLFQELSPADLATDYFFGSSVDVSGLRIAVGAVGGRGISGKAYVFEFDGVSWVEAYTLTPGLSDFEGYGYSIAIDREILTVGSPYKNVSIQPGAGSVHVHRRDTTLGWQEEGWIAAAVPGRGFEFGRSVDVDAGSERIAVGESKGANLVGQAHTFVYQAGAWHHEAAVIHTEPATLDDLGFSVAVEGDLLAVGAPGTTLGSDRQGSVAVFRNPGTGWVEETKLLGPWNNSGEFGYSLDLKGSLLAVGAPLSNWFETAGGVVLVYRELQGKWKRMAPVRATDLRDDSHLGWNVGISHSTLIAGAPGFSSDRGCAYLYEMGPVADCRELFPIPTPNNGRTGMAVAIDRDRMLVASPYDNNPGIDNGSVAAFEWDGDNWVTPQTIVPAVPAGQRFGISLAMDGDRAVIGADRDTVKAGKMTGTARVLVRSGGSWVHGDRLEGSDCDDGAHFGTAVDIDGNRIAVSAPNQDSNVGAVYIFEWNGVAFVEVQKVVGTDPVARFGHSISLSGDRLAVGAAWDNGDVGQGGAVYLYDHDGSRWVFDQRVVPSDIGLFARFGTAVNVDGDRLIASAPSHPFPEETGQVYVFLRQGGIWQETQIIMPASPDVRWFGSSLDVFGDRMIIGASEDMHVDFSAGSAWLYRSVGTDWAMARRYIASDASRGQNFGYSAAISRDWCVMGAPDFGVLFDEQGAAWTCRISELALGVTPDVASQGDPFRFELCGGYPGSWFLISVIAVNGAPTFVNLFYAPFNQLGAWSLEGNVRPGMAGIEITLLGIGLGGSGRLGQSDPAVMTFQ